MHNLSINLKPLQDCLKIYKTHKFIIILLKHFLKNKHLSALMHQHWFQSFLKKYDSSASFQINLMFTLNLSWQNIWKILGSHLVTSGVTHILNQKFQYFATWAFQNVTYNQMLNMWHISYKNVNFPFIKLLVLIHNL